MTQFEISRRVAEAKKSDEENMRNTFLTAVCVAAVVLIVAVAGLVYGLAELREFLL